MRERVTALFSPEVRSCFHRSTLLQKESVVLCLLFIWGLFVYYQHQGGPLRGDEGMYAALARRIVPSGEWFRLEYEGRPYFNKPPLYFWQIALSMLVWGPSEFAIRFPSATFGIATMFLVFWCGTVFFNRRVGLLAALVTATTFASVFFAHQARFDIQLGFWMTVALFAFYLAYRGGGRRLGYLSLAFLSVTVGTMLKGPVAIILPGIVALAFLVITRRSKVVMEVSFLTAGLAGFLLITGVYYWRLGEPFNRHFFVGENLTRLYHGDKPAFFYLYMLFPDFFPWSLFVPALGLYLWMSRSLHSSEEDLLLRVWSMGFLLLLSLPSDKREQFLVYLIPPFALLMGRYWDHLLSYAERVTSADDRFLRVTATLLVTVTLGVMFAGPSLLERRYRIPPDFWSIPFALLLGVACAGVLFTAWKSRPRAICVSVLALSLMLTFAHVQFFYPALERYDSAIPFSRQVRAVVGQSPLVLTAGPDWGDILYYLDRPNPVPLLTPDEVSAALRSDGQVFGLMTKDQYDELVRRGDPLLVRLPEYSYRWWKFVLVSNQPR